MRTMWTIAKKEYQSFFHTPIAYVIGVVVFLVLGIYYWLQLSWAIQSQSFIPEISSILDLLLFPMFFIAVPVLTMRTVADENRTGTLELLMTAPVRDWELIVGKWLGTYLFLLTLIAITWIYPLVLNLLVEPGIDQSLLVANYLGLCLFTAALTAIGVFISSLFKNQIAALITSLGVIILLWILSSPAQLMTGFGADLLNYLSITNHYYETFRIGIVNLKDIIYYLSLTFFTLFLATRAIEARRWK
jgi:ABC-2 type transport system permease protein